MSETLVQIPMRPSVAVLEAPEGITDQLDLAYFEPFLPGYRTSLSEEELTDFNKLDRDLQLQHLAQICIEKSQEVATQSLNNLGHFVKDGKKAEKYIFPGFYSLHADNFRRKCIEKICESLDQSPIDELLSMHAKKIFEREPDKTTTFSAAQVGPILIQGEHIFDEDGILIFSSFQVERQWQ